LEAESGTLRLRDLGHRGHDALRVLGGAECSAEVTMDLLVTLRGFEKVDEENGHTRYLTTSSGGSFAHYRNKQTGSSG
jgi:hypothetical protein